MDLALVASSIQIGHDDAFLQPRRDPRPGILDTQGRAVDVGR
jgi:hypothetical protein